MERKEMNHDQMVGLKLSVVRALVGEVRGNLAGVYASIEGTQIHLYAYFFGEPAEEDREHIGMVEGYVIADYTEPFTIETHLDLISNAPRKGVPWLFLRAETMPGA